MPAQLLAAKAIDGGTDDMVQWTLTDHLNTVRDIAKYDPAMDTTSIVNHLLYDVFGRATSESNPAVDSLFLFTARPFDNDIQFQNNLNRWYNPAVGRWLSEDPIGFDGGDGNLYRYVGNGVVGAVDQEGLRDWNPNAFYTLTAELKNVHAGHWGDFEFSIAWQIRPRATKAPKETNRADTGWIIQHVIASFDVCDAHGNRVRHPADDGHWDYWEAWSVAPGEASPRLPKVGNRPIDDSFAIYGGITDTCGTIAIVGNAYFYPNTQLPSGFFRNNPTTHALELLSTSNGSAVTSLQPRSNPAAHAVVAWWSPNEMRGRTQLVTSTTIIHNPPDTWLV